MQFILTPAFQQAIPTTNWMYPVTDTELPPGFASLAVPEKALQYSAQQVAEQRNNWIRHGNAPSAADRRQPVAGRTGRHAADPVALLAFGALWLQAPENQWRTLWRDSYLWHVIRFTFWQAFLSALLSTLPAVFLARALYRRRFPGHRWLLRLCAMTLVLPVLVAVFGLLSVYGRQGWLAHLLEAAGLPYRFSPYGLQGILLAHIFFNLPLATRLLLQSLEGIATEQRQLAAQLGMNGWQHFRIVEWPWLRRQIPPTAALIFMLCFASFATVLSLGEDRGPPPSNWLFIRR